MSTKRSGVGAGVLDGIIYAVGGGNGRQIHKSVEAYNPKTGVWQSIPDMHIPRKFPGNLYVLTMG